VLKIKQELDIISKSEEESSIKYHSVIYGAGGTTVSDIRNNKQNNYASSSDSTGGLSK
jgi:hypothetical protein